MGTDLGARLVQAGLVTRAQLRRALARAPANEGALVAALAHDGVDQDGLAGFFIAQGLGPLVPAEKLSESEVPASATARVPARMAHALYALPIKETPAGLMVAMLAPSDAHARAELARTAGGQILPALARAVDLRAALRRVYPDAPPSERPATRDSEPPVLELVQRRPSRTPPPDAAAAVPLVRHKPVTGPSTVPAHSPRSAVTPPPAPPAPPTLPAPTATPGRRIRKKAITRDFERPTPEPRAGGRDGDRVEGRSADGAAEEHTAAEEDTTVDLVLDLEDLQSPRQTPGRGWAATRERTETRAPLQSAAREAAERVAREAHPPPPEPSVPVLEVQEAAPVPDLTASGAPMPLTVAKSRAKPAPRSIIPPDHDSWEPGVAPAAPTVSSRPPVSRRPAPIGGTLAAIRASRRRDDVVALSCQGALTVARAAVLLALRKNVLKGLGGAGAGLSSDAIRNLWIPTSSPSMFRDVALTHEPYVGAHGTTAADGLFRAALGSRGGDVALMPVTIGGKLVAILAASEVRFASAGAERVEILARAAGEALERIIVESKKRD